MTGEAVEVFFSYSHKDRALREELAGHLEPLRLDGSIQAWHDGCIEPGAEWDREIKENLKRAQVILLLISSDFIKSRYCQEVELKQAMLRHETGDAYVIPIILRHCMWQVIPFGNGTLGKLQALPQPLEPVKSWSDPDEAFTRIAEGLKGIIQRLREERASLSTQRQGLAQTVSVAEAAREDTNTDAADSRAKEVELRSEKGVDYRKLQQLLQARDWKAADYETYLRMLEVVGRKEGDWIRDDELLSFPCADLLTIDGLWVKYSQGRFGFSVQQRIYVECGGTLDGEYPGDKIWEAFERAVGWRHENYGILDAPYADSGATFNTTAPRGHLPLWGWFGVALGGWGGFMVVCRFFSRIQTCKV